MSDDSIQKDTLKQKSKGGAKQDASRQKHNRNAESEPKFADTARELTEEQRVTRAIAQRGYRHRPKKYRDITRERMVGYRAQGLSYPEIAAQRGMPSIQHMEEMRADDPELAERCTHAYDGYIRVIVETSVKLTQDIDQVDDRAEKLAENALKIRVPPALKQTAMLRAAQVITRNQTARVYSKTYRVRTALAVAERRLPDEWGLKRDQDQQVIVIETPGGWMIDAATGRPEDEDGQGPDAAAARERWQRDVTPGRQADAAGTDG